MSIEDCCDEDHVKPWTYSRAKKGMSGVSMSEKRSRADSSRPLYVPVQQLSLVCGKTNEVKALSQKVLMHFPYSTVIVKRNELRAALFRCRSAGSSAQQRFKGASASFAIRLHQALWQEILLMKIAVTKLLFRTKAARVRFDNAQERAPKLQDHLGAES